MEYFAGLDVSMAETHVCVVTRNGAVIHTAKVRSTPADIAAALAQVPRISPVHPGAALVMNAMLHLDRNEPGLALRRIEAAEALVDEHELGSCSNCRSCAVPC